MFYRLKGKYRNSLDITKKLINYTENDIKNHLDKEGTIWILFDPLSYSDLGSEKAFINSVNRKNILPDYKANRKYSNLFLETIELYRKYYFYRGDKIKLVYSDEYEADDFVSPILKIIQEENKLSSKGVFIALLSNDLDFARYIQGRKEPYAEGFVVDLINKSWDTPYTTKEFFNTFKFMPTEATVTLFKALYGDKSDNISGTIFMKKAQFLCPEGIKMLCLNLLNYINENNISLDDFIKNFKTAVYHKIQNEQNKGPFEDLYVQLKLNDLKIPIIDKLFTNINVIRSQLENKKIDDLIHCNPVNESINSIIHQSVFGISFKNIFGRV